MTRVLTLNINVMIAGQAKKTTLLPRVSCNHQKYEQVEVPLPFGTRVLAIRTRSNFQMKTYVDEEQRVTSPEEAAESVLRQRCLQNGILCPGRRRHASLEGVGRHDGVEPRSPNGCSADSLEEATHERNVGYASKRARKESAPKRSCARHVSSQERTTSFGL